METAVASKGAVNVCVAVAHAFPEEDRFAIVAKQKPCVAVQSVVLVGTVYSAMRELGAFERYSSEKA